MRFRNSISKQLRWNIKEDNGRIHILIGINISNILPACDRSVGKKRLQKLTKRTRNENVWFIIEKRGMKYEP